MTSSDTNHLRIKIIGRICDSRGWGHCAYHGKMSHENRAKTIGGFRKKKEIKIMIASLKCGGVGLNLTCASRVINIDLFWVCPTLLWFHIAR